MIECPEKIHIKSRSNYDIKQASNDPSSSSRIMPVGEPRKLRFNRNQKLKERFTRLSNVWHEEMDGVSSVQVKTSHWAYQAVIELGGPIVPYIMEELIETKDGGWFFALTKILKHNPVHPEHKMNMDQVLDDWVKYTQELRLDF